MDGSVHAIVSLMREEDVTLERVRMSDWENISAGIFWG